jgi:hypothetical protein
MRKLIMAWIVTMLLGVAALAESRWKGAGWYQVDDSMYGVALIAGPFGDKDSCLVGLPASDDEGDYLCEYFSERPKWDE